METIIKDIDKITCLLYQQKQADAYKELVKLLPQLAKVAEELMIKYNEVVILDGLRKSVEAMESNDLTLLADILSYEVKEKLQEYIG